MKNVIRKKEKNIANGVFIFGKFITQSLDEPERQIIYFFLYNCLAVSRAVYAYFETPYHVLPNLYNTLSIPFMVEGS